MDLVSHPRLEERIAIYKTAFALIKEHWFFGYGYGSTLVVNIKDFVSTSNLPKYYIDTFPGGHPHNLALLFWLEFGIIGATFLAYYIHKLLVYIIENTYNYTNQAAILSLVVAFDIISSFSWSIWWPSVLLTFAFFGIMLTLSMNIKSLKIKPIKT
jgi:O-antigen ligase